MKKFLIGVVALLSIVPTVYAAPPTAAEQVFSDVGSLDPDVRDAILQLVLSDTVHGYSDGTYRPQQSILRKEIVKLFTVPVLHRLATDDEEFSTLLRTGAIADIVAEVRSRNLLDATLQDTDLDKLATRREAVLTIVAAYGLSGEVAARPFTTTLFIDIQPRDGDFAAVVEYLRERQIIEGRDETHFAPDNLLTRAEAAKISYRAEQVFIEGVEFEEVNSDAEEPPLEVVSSRVKIVDVVPRKLVAGEDATVLFTVTSSRGDPIGGLSFGDDIIANVVKSQAEIVSREEVGYGLYVLGINVPRTAHPGPICIDILYLRGRNDRASTCDWTPSENEQAVTSRVSLARLVPATLSVGEEALVIATPRDHRGNPVSGLSLSAHVVRGAGQVTEQMEEDPAGSGVYVGKFKADSVPSPNLEIRIQINDSATGESTVIQGVVRY